MANDVKLRIQTTIRGAMTGVGTPPPPVLLRTDLLLLLLLLLRTARPGELEALGGRPP